MSAKKSATERIVTDFLIDLILWPLAAWEVMVAIGVVHGSWWPQVPTIGYWAALVITMLLGGTARALLRPARPKDGA